MQKPKWTGSKRNQGRPENFGMALWCPAFALVLRGHNGLKSRWRREICSEQAPPRHFRGAPKCVPGHVAEDGKFAVNCKSVAMVIKTAPCPGRSSSAT